MSSHNEKHTTTPPEKNDDNTSNILEVVPHPKKEEIVYPTGLKLAAIIFALCLAVLLVALDQTIIATAIPRITDRFNSVGDIGWYGSAYFLTTTSLQPTFGRIYKTFSVSLLPTAGYFIKIHPLTNNQYRNRSKEHSSSRSEHSNSAH
jgi:hypothetical protein